MTEANVKLSGDEARMLLSLMVTLPIFQLYQKLTALSLVQPPAEPTKEN
jgi:hypothetical protein